MKPSRIFRGGKWTDLRAKRSGDVFNPSTGQVIARVPFATAEQTGDVVEAAAAALPAWSETPVVERARLMFRFRALLEQHFEELAALVTREHGKTLAEARAEVNRGIEVVEFACGIPSLIMGEMLPNIAADVDAEAVRHPVGVCVGITPYNFPFMVPLWMFPIALTCGNTFVLKPSEKVPLSAVRLGELLTEAGLPDGVFNIVHGDRECVDALLDHPQVAAISFVGSTAIAKYIYERGTRHGKRVQSAGGAKNHLIIMPDADLDQTVKALAASAFGCAGQRCMAGSVAVAVGKAGDPVVEGLVDYAGKMRVGPTDGNEERRHGPGDPRRASRPRRQLSRHRQAATARPSPSTAAAISSPTASCSARASSIACGPTMRVWKEEIFGPVLSVVRAADLDEALAVGDAMRIRQRRRDLHPQRLRGPPVQAALQRRHDRHQRRRARPDGLVPVHRLEPLVLRRPAHPRHRKHPVLHPPKSDAHPLAQVGRLAPRPGLAARSKID